MNVEYMGSHPVLVELTIMLCDEENQSNKKATDKIYLF